MSTRYILPSRHGFAAKPTSSKGTELNWTKDHLAAALVLNPSLLALEDHLLVARGGYLANLPHLAFIDGMGRLTILELAHGTAGIDALARLLGFGLSWGRLPNGEVDQSLREYTRKGQAQALVSDEVERLSGLLGLSGQRQRLAAQAASARLLVDWRWADKGSSDLADLAVSLFGPHALSLAGVPARLVLVAREFDESCCNLAEALASREANVQLFVTDLRRASEGDSLLLDLRAVQAQAHLDRCWSAARRVWQRRFVREHFIVNAWTDHGQKNAITFASKTAPKARVWLSARPDGRLDVSSRVPHRWHSKTSLRQQITETFASALRGITETENTGDFGRTFPSNADLDEVARCAEAVAKALLRHVVPHEPEE